MRKIDWEKPLSDADVAWLNTTGILGIEARIKANREQFSDAPTDDVEGFEDDYDEWKVGELEAEVAKRELIAPIDVVATGAHDKVLKADMVKALRLWDQTNPDTES